MAIESLHSRYAHKVKTPEELRAILGPVPRERPAIMCHGVFDVVHPGHVRHLIYAKSRADILIASITADRHISKGHYRPHVPQELRALNLAAFEMIDYVVIDPNPTPIANIGIIQPDFLAKGYEYSANGLPPRTLEEAEALKSYGGEIVFTPGDIVYSSSVLINANPPDLKLDKLQVLMDQRGLTFDHLLRTIDNLAGHSLHVVGDTIVDSYTHCTMIGGQTKTPTMSVLFEKRTDFVGGAAIVAKHCRAAGADVTFSTVLGEDEHKQFVLDDLAQTGIHVNPFFDKRPTVNKNAVVVGGYRLLKIDTLDNSSISDDILTKISHCLSSTPAEAVIFADFRHGLFNRRTIPALIRSIPPGAYRVADSQVASRWGNITEFEGFDLITPNEREARFALGDQDSGIRPLASQLYDAAKCKFLILKLGERGVLACYNSDHESLDSFSVIDSFAENVVDAVGAGDALLAYSTMAMLASRDAVQATILGTIAASCECEFDGNMPITPDLVRDRLLKVRDQTRYTEAS